MTGLGIGMRIMRQRCTCDSQCLCQGHPLTVSVLPYEHCCILCNVLCVFVWVTERAR